MSASHRPAVPRQDAGITRRGVVTGAAAAAAVTALPLSVIRAAPAEAAYLPNVRPYRDTPLPSTAVRHMANRFAYGYTPGLRREMNSAGGARAWFEKQLQPASIDDTTASTFASWYPNMRGSASSQWDANLRTMGYAYQVSADIARWSMLRRIYSRRQVLEVMTEFWLNHLHVYNFADLTWLWRYDYDATIRRHALGRYDAMLQAAIVHPTMLTYLDADKSSVRRTSSGTVEKINENLGRELLELHTVGREAAYTEDMVKDSARILTGWTIDRFGSWSYGYDPDIHFTGPVKVLGFTHANGDRDGRAVLRAYLQYLAHHPATAQRIARKLAVRFVSDSPSQQLVDHLAAVFTKSGTDIKATLRALVDSAEFSDSVGAKVRTPTDDVCATFRVLGARINRPDDLQDAAKAIFYLSRTVGQTPFGWGPPDGFPQTAAAWSTPGRMMGSFHMHHTTAGHWYPRTGVTYRPHDSWLPQPRIRFDAFVDHLCRVLHGRPSTSRILGAASIAVEVAPSELVDRDSLLVKWRMPFLIGLLLDTPQHLMK